MEKWRLSKKLGSLLGDREDIMRRKLLAAVALKSVMKDWLRYCPGNPSLRSRIYNAFVKPVLLYNSSTWGISDTELKNLDSFHRKQLRVLNGLHWPKKINNSSLYKLSNSVPVSQDIIDGRWRLFGHVLRMDPSSPAYQAMEEYFLSDSPKFRGRPRTTLPVALEHDLKHVGKTLKKCEDLDELRWLAQNRRGWQTMVKKIVSCVARVGI
ncbi:uncharacterized protein LOC115227110 [Octopus sinensis]|uniref:Uncharacterized protein LOC115227110 n=1 Tax=Octopus sinensis TaxID=2607531 RepID=A0A6P7TX80_9MOLL|nr:uncharacterized protein LOC115227110 [Octopus sinensis]